MKIRPVAAQLLDADGQTDTMKLTVAVRNFSNSPIKAKNILHIQDVHHMTLHSAELV
jgi:hypothetical protein